VTAGIVSNRSCVFAAVLLLLATVRAQEPADLFAGPNAGRAAQWLAAVKAHEPGNPAKPAIEVSTWPGVEVEEVILGAKRYARSLAKTRPDEANDLLLRGATMHADIAQLIPNEIVRRSPKQQRMFVVEDGREQGSRFVSIHWELGRSLLDDISPEPASNAGVLLWYQRVAMDLLRLRSLAEAAVHLPRARRMFPSDAALLFANGILHERFASAALQAAAASVVAANRGATSVSPARAELARAERFFRETLAVQPDHLEARVRHGRVLGVLGRHEQAVEALQLAIGAGVTGEWLYFTELFLGSEKEAAGNDPAARGHFERAAALYPHAQSPRLALSQLSRRAGDRGGAQREVRVLAELPEGERRREDPWWNYFEVR